MRFAGVAGQDPTSGVAVERHSGVAEGLAAYSNDPQCFWVPPRTCGLFPSAVNQASEGIAPSASFSRVQTFMFTTTATISNIATSSKCAASLS